MTIDVQKMQRYTCSVHFICYMGMLKESGGEKKEEMNSSFEITWQRAYFTKRLCQPLKCLTSVFGMGTGVTTSLSPPDLFSLPKLPEN